MYCNTVLVNVVQLLMMMISTNTAELTIKATRDVLVNNMIRLTCHFDDSHDTTAAFYRRVPQDGRELLIDSNVRNVEFVITIHTEGAYFCNSSVGQSTNFEEINSKLFPGGTRKKNYRPQAKKWVGGLRGFLHKKSFCVNFSHYISGALYSCFTGS